MKGEHGTLLQLHCKIANAASQLSPHDDFPSLGAQIAQLLQEHGLGFTSLCVYLIDRDQGKGRNYYLHPGPAGWVDQGFTIDMAPLAAHVEQQSRMWQDPHSQAPLWFLTVPTALGAVEIADHRPKAFSPEEQQLLSGLASCLQLLVIRHRDLGLLENLGAHTTRTAADLEILRGSSSEIYGSDPSLVAQRIVQVVLGKFSFDRAGVFLVDEKAGLLRGAWGVDQRGEIVPIASTVLPLRCQHPEQLSQAARLVRGELDYFLTQDLDGEGGRSAEGNIAANLAVPLRLGRRIIGVLCVDNYFTSRPIGQEQVLPLMLLANQAALALENSSLHRELKQAKEEGLEGLEATELLPGRRPFCQRQDEPDLFGQLVAQSPGMRQVVELARLATTTDNTVLILGESGTGKDLLAHAIHAQSRRGAGSLVVVNSASLSSGLEDSELFGHVKGAFTNAIRENTGLVAAAHGGTLFLDEIGDLSSSSQAKLLRTLESGEMRRVGDTRVQKVDIRFIAATNRDLRQAVEEGVFRADLYYRLAVITIQIPPLRERPEDIPLLVRGFLGRITAEMGRIPEITPAILDLLMRFSWPGNARQLDSCLRHAALLAGGGAIAEEHLPEEVLQSPLTTPVSPHLALADLERRHILQVLEQCGRDRQKAQHLLGISRATLQRRLKEYGLTL